MSRTCGGLKSRPNLSNLRVKWPNIFAIAKNVNGEHGNKLFVIGKPACSLLHSKTREYINVMSGFHAKFLRTATEIVAESHSRIVAGNRSGRSARGAHA